VASAEKRCICRGPLPLEKKIRVWYVYQGAKECETIGTFRIILSIIIIIIIIIIIMVVGVVVVVVVMLFNTRLARTFQPAKLRVALKMMTTWVYFKDLFF
jgi:hypothetical protein